jgi:hypothetical protein
MPDDVGSIERHIEEEPQHRTGAVDRSRAYSARRQMQQIAADIFPAARRAFRDTPAAIDFSSSPSIVMRKITQGGVTP